MHREEHGRKPDETQGIQSSAQKPALMMDQDPL